MATAVLNGHLADGLTVNGHLAKDPSTTAAVEVSPPQESSAKTVPRDYSREDTKCGPPGRRLVVDLVDELGREYPEKIWATITRSTFDIEQGFRDVTFANCTRSVDATAWSIETQLGKSSTFDVIAYLGVSDIRYAMYLFACIKTGYQLMIPSVRNSTQQHVAVFNEANCSRVYYTPEMAPIVKQLQEKMPHLQAFEAPSLDDMLASSSPPYPYNKKWEEAYKDPIIIAHSSGSTG